MKLCSLTACSLLFAIGCHGDTADTDTDTDGSPTNEIPNDWGFVMRLPHDRTLDCGDTSQTFSDRDWLCTYDYDGATGVVYAQSTPATCVQVMDYQAVYQSTGEINLGQGAQALGSVVYDWGGNHQNDTLEFETSGQRFRYSHSSFGFGWRKCHDMDCAQVYSSDGADLIQDGCTCDRTVPITCSSVQPDGTWADLVDTFAVCNGDSTCGQ